MSNKFKFGEKVELGCYQKVCRPEHVMKKFQGFGISQSELDLMKKLNVKLIRIVYLGKEVKVFMVSVAQYFVSDLMHVFDESDVQKFVKISDMWELK